VPRWDDLAQIIHVSIVLAEMNKNLNDEPCLRCDSRQLLIEQLGLGRQERRAGGKSKKGSDKEVVLMVGNCATQTRIFTPSNGEEPQYQTRGDDRSTTDATVASHPQRDR
jgi:hypothetical protein